MLSNLKKKIFRKMKKENATVSCLIKALLAI